MYLLFFTGNFYAIYLKRSIIIRYMYLYSYAMHFYIVFYNYLSIFSLSVYISNSNTAKTIDNYIDVYFNLPCTSSHKCQISVGIGDKFCSKSSQDKFLLQRQIGRMYATPKCLKFRWDSLINPSIYLSLFISDFLTQYSTITLPLK